MAAPTLPSTMMAETGTANRISMADSMSVPPFTGGSQVDVVLGQDGGDADDFLPPAVVVVPDRVRQFGQCVGLRRADGVHDGGPHGPALARPPVVVDVLESHFSPSF